MLRVTGQSVRERAGSRKKKKSWLEEGEEESRGGKIKALARGMALWTHRSSDQAAAAAADVRRKGEQVALLGAWTGAVMKQLAEAECWCSLGSV